MRSIFAHAKSIPPCAAFFSICFCGIVSLETARGQDVDPPEQTIGERLFLETRFAQYFFTNSTGNANATLTAGDPALDNTVTTSQPMAGPFHGQSMNCRACHLVDEQNATLGNRTYDDFARRSPVPDRGDGLTVTPRNSPPLVDALLARKPMLLHFDGEFPTPKDLIKGTLTGRNYGWLPEEQAAAVAHVAHIIRDDDGTSNLAQEYGGFSYRTILTGTDTNIPPEFRLPRKFRLNVAHANDKQILAGIAALIQAYMESLVFSRDDQGRFNGSPYDVFLQKNGLPRKPAPEESPAHYAARLLKLVQNLSSPQFVTDADGSFVTHTQAFQFGSTELAGLKIFFAASNSSPAALQTGGVGNCTACHLPPRFTDFRFHNTGATQEEYDSIHGTGTFAQLPIPGLKERRKNYDAYLPKTPYHPNASDAFRSMPQVDNPSLVDLGVWNIFANSDFPKSQNNLRRALDEGSQSPAAFLPKTIARFKTPGLRDLAHSEPYLHTGRMDSLEQVVDFYRQFSELTRAGNNRNGDPELRGIALTGDDTAPLAAFLRGLTEDYQ